MTQEKDENTIKQISEGLDTLDGFLKVNTPGMDRFSQLVAGVDRKKKSRARLEFMAFLVLDMVLLSGAMLAYCRSFTAFIAVQLLSVLVIPACILIWYKSIQRRKQGDSL